MPEKLTAQQMVARLEGYRAGRAQWEPLWQEIIDYLFMRRKPVTGEEIKGARRGTKIYDNEAGKALTRLAATLHAMLTSGHWFDLETDDDELNKDPVVKEWLDVCEKILSKSLDNSNFSTEVYELYIDLASICTACMFISESKRPGKDFYFSTRHIKEYFISEDEEGKVDTVYRVIEMKARHIMERWGENAPEKVKKSFKANKTEEEFNVLNAVFKREAFDLKNKPKDSILNMPFESRWIFIEAGGSGKEIKGTDLSESGYPEFPFAVPRWAKSSGDVQGRGPGFEAMPSTRTANAMKKTILRTGQRVAEPPLDIPVGYDKVSLAPAALNYYDSTSGNKERIKTIDIGANMPLTRDLLNDERDSIRDVFFSNQLQLVDRAVMTAEEVRQRTEENMRVLGPMFGRFQPEFLEVVVLNGFAILRRNNKLPEPPKVLEGKDLRVRYVSPLAKAQQLNEVKAVTYTVETAKNWAEIKPDVTDNINFDEAIRMVADLDGTPLSVMVDEKEVKKTRDDRKAAQEEQARLEREALQAQSAKTVTEGAKNLGDMKGAGV